MNVLGLASLLVAPAVLVWSPKAGDKAVYDITGKAVFGGMNATLRGKLTRTVKTVEPSSVVLLDDREIHLKLDGQDLEQDAPLSPTTSVFGTDGTLRSLTTDYSPINLLRLGRLTDLVMPKNAVAAGESWTVEVPPDPKIGAFGARLTFTLVGEERAAGKDAYKISEKGTETGTAAGKVEATYWIDRITGMWLRAHFTVTGVDTGPGEEGAPSRYEEDLLLRP